MTKVAKVFWGWHFMYIYIDSYWCSYILIIVLLCSIHHPCITMSFLNISAFNTQVTLADGKLTSKKVKDIDEDLNSRQVESMFSHNIFNLWKLSTKVGLLNHMVWNTVKHRYSPSREIIASTNHSPGAKLRGRWPLLAVGNWAPCDSQWLPMFVGTCWNYRTISLWVTGLVA